MCFLKSPWTRDTRICMCARVCEPGSAERNEGHPNDLGQLQVEKAYGDLSILMFSFCPFYFFGACMYEEYLHSLTSSLSSEQHWSSMCALYPCLPVTRHPSDCQGISQVVQLTLTYFICVIWGSITFPSLSVMVDTQGLAWNTVIACMAGGCLIFSSSSFLTLIRSQDGQQPLHFLAVL